MEVPTETPVTGYISSFWKGCLGSPIQFSIELGDKAYSFFLSGAVWRLIKSIELQPYRMDSDQISHLQMMAAEFREQANRLDDAIVRVKARINSDDALRKTVDNIEAEKV